tara:strand:- start:346 stop:798 length:453 start_codon:yes stop_codon:yes gene_type:complete
MKTRRVLSLFLVLMIIPSSGCLSGEIDDFYGEDISPPIPVDDFVLVDENGETVSMSDFEGKVVVVAFLFTRCPDICPVVSANLAFVEQELGRPAWLFCSDPDGYSRPLDGQRECSEQLCLHKGTRVATSDGCSRGLGACLDELRRGPHNL